MIRTCPVCQKVFKAQGTKTIYCSRQCAGASPARRARVSEGRKAMLATDAGKAMYQEAMKKRSALPYYQRREKPEARQRNIDGQRAEYKKWRLSVIKRDDYTCQKCGKRGVILQAHHIKEWSKHPELRYDVSNGISLCLQCHSDEHGYWMHTNKKCPVCQTVFAPNNMKQVCCSVACSNIKKRNEAEPKPTHVCENCKKEFTGYNYGKHKFCCLDCYWEWMRGKKRK